MPFCRRCRERHAIYLACAGRGGAAHRHDGLRYPDSAESTDPATIEASYRAAHERLVDNPPWLFIVHDLNPRAMNKRVQGFVSARSWFLDLTLVSMH
jgi:hypothetical protein